MFATKLSANVLTLLRDFCWPMY